MRLVHIAAACATLIFSLVLVRTGAQTTVSAADLFNDAVMHDVRLLINSRDLQRLRERSGASFNVPADLLWRDLRVRNVGVRVRGLGSRNSVKPGLDLTFDRYTKGQTFLGLTNLVLDNLWQDPSLLRESLGMKVFRQLGHAAPRESFARLYINNELQGVYGLVEPIDARFTARAIGEASGRLFEFRYETPFYGEYLGADLTPYKQLFEPRPATVDTDAIVYGPIRDLFREANNFSDDTWRQRVDEMIDLPQLMSHIAIQGCLANNDGVMGYAGFNNFYLYRFAGSKRHRVFPWDEDFGFQAIDWSILRRGDQPVQFVDRAMAEPDLRALFLDTAESCARLIEGEGWLMSEIDRVMALVGPSILADTRKQFSNDAVLADVQFLRDFAAGRPALVLAEIASLR